jgi:hypothetical protein
MDELFLGKTADNASDYGRLLMSVYDPTTKALLGTTLSGPIRALANNDVPKGAAAIEMKVSLPGETSRRRKHVGCPWTYVS